MSEFSTSPAVAKDVDEEVAYPFGAPEPVALPNYPAGYANAPKCRYCGSVPAVDVTFRGHRGLVLMMVFREQSGPMCRDCGTAVFRKLTAQTLVQGWWGFFSFVVTPVILLLNLARRSKVAGLDAPQFPAAGRKPASIGKPVYERWEFVGIAVPIIVIIFLIARSRNGA